MLASIGAHNGIADVCCHSRYDSDPSVGSGIMPGQPTEGSTVKPLNFH